MKAMNKMNKILDKEIPKNTLIFLVLMSVIFYSLYVYALSLNDIEVYYSFDNNDKNSTHVFDLTGNNNHAAINNVDFVAGKLRQAIQADNNFEFVNATGIIVNEDQPFTINFWMYKENINSTNNDMNFIWTRNNVANNFEFIFQYPDYDSGAGLTVQLNKVGVAGDNIDSGSTLQNETWYMITFRYNGTQNGGELYIDNILNATGSYPSSASTVNSNPYTAIGIVADSQIVNLTIDEFSFWNRSLTTSEISELYNLGSSFNPYASDNFTIRAIDIKDSSIILISNATINGTFYSSNISTGNIESSIPKNSTGTINATVSASGFYDSTYLNVMPNDFAAGTLNANMTSIVPRHTITAINATNSATINTFNITGDNGFFLQTTTGSLVYNGTWNTTTTATIRTDSFETKSIEFNNTVENDYQFSLRTTNTFNITIYDETLNQIITWDNITISIISPDVYQENITTQTGSVTFDLIVPSDYRINYRDLNNDTYYERNYYTTLNEGSFEQIDLYLLNQSYANVVNHPNGVEITVKDTVNNNLEGAIINVNKYFVSNNTYSTVERLSTNFDGQAISRLTSDGFYRFVIEYQNQTRLTTGQTQIFENSLTFRLNLIGDSTSDFKEYAGITTDLDWINSTSTFTLTFTDSDSVASSICLEVYETEFEGNTLLNQSCSTSQSGTILIGITPANNTAYEARAYATIDSTRVLLERLSISFKGGQAFDYGGNGLLIVFLLTIILAFMGIFNPVIALLITPLPLLFASIIGIIAIPTGVAIAVYAGFLVAAIVIGRKG
jgi:hypothetical protein